MESFLGRWEVRFVLRKNYFRHLFVDKQFPHNTSKNRLVELARLKTRSENE